MSWRLRTLGELVEPFSVRAKDYGGATGLSFLGVSNEDGITKSKYAAEGKAEDYKIIEKGCFAYNPYRINVGSIAYLDEDEKGLISPAYVIFKPKDKTVEPELLLKFLKSSEGIRQIKLHARGTVRQALRFEDLCKIEINLPDYKEQRPLINRLNSIKLKSDTVLTELINQQDLLSQLRQSFLREAMQGKLVKQDPKDGHAKDLLEKIKTEKAKSGRKEKELPPIKPEEIPFEIPENWVWCRLGDLTSLITSGSRNWNQYYSKQGALFIRSQNIKDTEIDLSVRSFVKLPLATEGLRTSVKKSDILITITGAGVSDAGLLESIDFSEGYVSQHVCLVRMINTEISKWGHYCIIARSVGKEQFKELIYGDKPGLNLTQINNLKIPFPPLSEQLRIIRKLSEILNLCDELQKSIQASREQNDALLQQVLKEALSN